MARVTVRDYYRKLLSQRNYERRTYQGNSKLHRRMDSFSNFEEGDEGTNKSNNVLYGNQTDDTKPGPEASEPMQGRRQDNNPAHDSYDAANIPSSPNEEGIPKDYGGERPPLYGEVASPPQIGGDEGSPQFRGGANLPFGSRDLPRQMMGRGMPPQFNGGGVPPQFQGRGGPPPFRDQGGRYFRDIPQYGARGGATYYGYEGNTPQYGGETPSQFDSTFRQGPPQGNRMALRTGMRYETEKGTPQYEAAEYSPEYSVGDEPDVPQDYGPGGSQNAQQMHQKPFRNGQDPRALRGQMGRTGGPPGRGGMGGPPGRGGMGGPSEYHPPKWGRGDPKSPGRVIYNPEIPPEFQGPMPHPGMGRGRPGRYGNYIQGKRPRTRGVNVQGMGAPSGQALLRMAKKKLAVQVVAVTPFPNLEAELKSLPQFDDFGAPIKWVKFNSNETIDGLAHVTDPKTGSNKQHVIKGTIYVPVIDSRILNSVLTTKAESSTTQATPPPGNETADTPQQYIMQTILRSVNINKTGPEDWLTMDAVIDKNIIDNCDGEGCQARCHKMNCESLCRGDSCASGCRGPGCLSMCDGENCDSRCWGKDCAATCSKFSCQMTTNGVYARNSISWDQAYPQYADRQAGGNVAVRRPVAHAGTGKYPAIGRVRPGRPMNYDYGGY